jgi:hypothetical protein
VNRKRCALDAPDRRAALLAVVESLYGQKIVGPTKAGSVARRVLSQAAGGVG